MAKKKRSSSSPLSIAIANEQSLHRVPAQLLRRAAREVLSGEGVLEATISLAIVDDPTIHRLNREYLRHDYPTDVLSFLLEQSDDGESLEGEIVISAETAASNAERYDSTVEREMLLYVIHGLLHLVGYDDHTPADRRTMRRKEADYLSRLGFSAPRERRRRSR